MVNMFISLIFNYDMHMSLLQLFILMLFFRTVFHIFVHKHKENAEGIFCTRMVNLFVHLTLVLITHGGFLSPNLVSIFQRTGNC